MNVFALCFALCTLGVGVLGQTPAARTGAPAANFAATGPPASGSGLSGLGLLGLASGSDMMRDMAMMSMLTNNRQGQGAPVGQRPGMDMGGLMAASMLTGADNMFRNMLMAKAFSGAGSRAGGGVGPIGTLALTGGLGDSFRRMAGLSMMSRSNLGANPLGLMAAGSALDLGFGMGGDGLLGSMFLLNSLNKSQRPPAPGGAYQQQMGGNMLMPWLLVEGF